MKNLLYLLLCFTSFATYVAGAGVTKLRVETEWYLSVEFGSITSNTELTNKLNYSISSSTDSNYSSVQHPQYLGRYEKAIDFSYDPDLHCITGHWMYLKLPYRLITGNVYTVTVSSMVCEAPFQKSVLYSLTGTTNLNIKVNHYGFYPDSRAKIAYVGGYLGDLHSLEVNNIASACYLYDAVANTQVYSGTLSVRFLRNHSYPGGLYPYDKEKRMSGENVYEWNFSNFTTPGEYYVAVPGFGRSFPFSISSNVYKKVFNGIFKSLYHNRCGHSVGPPYTTYAKHGVCHTHIEKTHQAIGSTPDDFINTNNSDHTFQTVIGGYHDAGDYDRRRQNIEVTRNLCVTAEILKDFDDFDIPESGNGIPDVLDEAAWSLRCWVSLQEPNGGVRAGVNTTGDAKSDEHADGDRQYYSYSVDKETTALFAAAAAWFARLMQDYDSSVAEEYLGHAKKAFEYLENHSASSKDLCNAGCQLYITTGSSVYHTAFLNGNAADRAKYGFSYARTTRPVNSSVKSSIISKWIYDADDAVGNLQNSGYRYSRNVYMPPYYGGAGSLAARDSIPLIYGYLLTSNLTYLTAAEHNASFILGANPLNTTWITKYGHQSPQEFMYVPSMVDGNDFAPGFLIFGPMSRTDYNKFYSRHCTAFMETLYPSINEPDEMHPHFRSFQDVCCKRLAPMGEFTVQETCGPAVLLFGFLKSFSSDNAISFGYVSAWDLDTSASENNIQDWIGNNVSLTLNSSVNVQGSACAECKINRCSSGNGGSWYNLMNNSTPQNTPIDWNDVTKMKWWYKIPSSIDSFRFLWFANYEGGNTQEMTFDAVLDNQWHEGEVVFKGKYNGGLLTGLSLNSIINDSWPTPSNAVFYLDDIRVDQKLIPEPAIFLTINFIICIFLKRNT